MVEESEMETLCNLFFELSNEDRMRILLRLQEKPSKLTHLSRELGLTVQESSRQLSRLGEVGLVSKDPEGLFHVTLYGGQAMSLLPGLSFLSRHKAYFESHTVAPLPEPFLPRIGELIGASFIGDTIVAISSVERMAQEAEEYIWNITSQYVVSPSGYQIYSEALDRGVQMRLIEREGYSAPPEILERVPPEVVEAFVNQRAQGRILDRVLKRIDINLYMTEKEVGLLAFPLQDGGFDYLGFRSDDPGVHGWCKDLFEHYWDRGARRTEFFMV